MSKDFTGGRKSVDFRVKSLFSYFSGVLRTEPHLIRIHVGHYLYVNIFGLAPRFMEMKHKLYVRVNA